MIEKTAYYLERNDELPNIELAVLLCETKDSAGIREIADGLKSKDSRLANDCIKVLYEIGERAPELITPYIDDFASLLKSGNNRLVWGGMTALAAAVRVKPDEVYRHMGEIMAAYKCGSVITRDNSISVFAGLGADDRYRVEMTGFIIGHLRACRAKELNQHTERAMPCIDKSNKAEFVAVLTERENELTEAQKIRAEKLKRQITKIL